MKIKDILASVGLPNTAAGKKKFYEMYPDEDSYKMAMGGSLVIGGLGYPYGVMEQGGMPCIDCDPFMAAGGGLDRDQDFGSKKNPYPSVSKGDFAGGGRSYPIPTRADAVDALRLAGLHGRSDVRAKVFAKYPELKKEFGGDIPIYQGDVNGSQTTGNNFPGYDPVKGTHMLAAGQPSLTSAQLTTAGYTQSPNNPDWFNQESNRFYKTFSPGQPGYVAPTSFSGTNTSFSSPIASPIKANTTMDTSSSNPIQQVNTGNVFKSRPVLGQKQQGGIMSADLEGTYPMFNIGGEDLSMSDFRKYLGRVKKEGGASFPGEGEQEIIAKRKGEFLQTLTDNYDTHVMNTMQEEGFFAGGGSQDNGMNALMNFLAQRGQGDGYTYMPYNQRGYGMGKKDFARFSKLPASTQFQGISKVNYGLMGRLAPKFFGPKSIEFNTRNAYEDNMKMQPTDEASIRKMLKMGKQKKSDYQGPYPETENVSSQMAGSQDASYYDVPALNDDVRAAQFRDMGNPNSPIHMNQPNNITLNPTYEQFGPNPISKFAPLAEHAYGGYPKYYEGGPGVPAYGANRTGPSTKENQWMADDLNAGASNLQSKTNPAAIFQNYLDTDPEIQQRKIDDNLLRDPATNKPYQDNTFTLKKDPWGEQEAIGMIAGMEGLTSIRNASQRKKDAFNRSKTSTFGTSDADQAGADFRGDYNVNSGMFRYDQMVPVKNTGQSFTNEAIVKYGGDPFFKGGGSAPSANFWTASQINKAAQAFEYSEPEIDVNHTLGAVDREEANLEAEGGETAIVDVKGIPTHFDIKGPRHTAGGVPLNLPEDSFIFSDTKKMMVKGGDVLKQFGMTEKKGGYTPADIAKKITGGKYDMNYYRGVLADKDSDPLQRKTAEAMIANYNLKLAKLGLVQESMKGFPQGIPKIAEPWMTSMKINPVDLLQTQGQQDQPDGDMTAKFGGGLPKAQMGVGSVQAALDAKKAAHAASVAKDQENYLAAEKDYAQTRESNELRDLYKKAQERLAVGDDTAFMDWLPFNTPSAETYLGNFKAMAKVYGQDPNKLIAQYENIKTPAKPVVAKPAAPIVTNAKGIDVATAHETLEDIGTATPAEIEHLQKKGYKFIANGKTY